MTDYSKLVKALRYCAESGDFNCNKDCPMYPNYPKCLTKMDMDAAAAIEALQADMKTYGDTAFKEGYEMGFAAGEARAEKRMEPKRGEWIYKPKDAIEMMFTLPKCSVCGYESSDALNYCPNCGSLMRGEANERG